MLVGYQVELCRVEKIKAIVLELMEIRRPEPELEVVDSSVHQENQAHYRYE